MRLEEDVYKRQADYRAEELPGGQIPLLKSERFEALFLKIFPSFYTETAADFTKKA